MYPRIHALFGNLIVAALLVLGIQSPALAAAQSKSVETLGVAMAGSASSRREAIEDGLRNAVEQAMGTYLTADLVVENKRIVDERILSQTRGYIQEYTVLGEKERDGLYRVRLSATVKVGEIQNDLAAAGLLMRRKQLPRILVVAPAPSSTEAYLEDKQYLDSVRNIVEDAFLEKNFRIVEPANQAVRTAIARAGRDSGRMSRLAKDAGAEVLIVAQATRYFEREVELYGSRYDFYRSDVQLRILETGTGRVIYSSSRQGQSSAQLDPLYEATEALAHEGMQALLEKWSSDVSGSTTMALVVQGLDFAALQRLEDRLRGVAGVQALRRRSFDQGTAKLEIEYRGDADGFAARLAKLERPALSITGVTQQAIEAELKE